MSCKENETWHSVVEARFEPTDKPKRVGDYILGRILGEGRCGVVREAVSQGSGRKVAVKVLVKYRSRRGDHQRQCFRREVESLRRVRHPNVVSLYETMETARCMYLVLEHVTGGTLQHVLKLRKCLNVEEVRLVMRQLVSATDHIHRSAIIHREGKIFLHVSRDIKPANILVCNNQRDIKLIDFGLSARADTGEILTQCGTPVYSAPEMYSGTGYGSPVDVWSLGVILHEMLTGRTPFSHEPHRSLSQLHGSILRAVIIPSSVPPDCAVLIKSILSINPETRPTSRQLMLEPWFAHNSSLYNSSLDPEDHIDLIEMASGQELSDNDLSSENNIHKNCDSVKLDSPRKGP